MFVIWQITTLEQELALCVQMKDEQVLAVHRHEDTAKQMQLQVWSNFLALVEADPFVHHFLLNVSQLRRKITDKCVFLGGEMLGFMVHWERLPSDALSRLWHGKRIVLH